VEVESRLQCCLGLVHCCRTSLQTACCRLVFLPGLGLPEKVCQYPRGGDPLLKSGRRNVRSCSSSLLPCNGKPCREFHMNNTWTRRTQASGNEHREGAPLACWVMDWIWKEGLAETNPLRSITWSLETSHLPAIWKRMQRFFGAETTYLPRMGV
jgi:hypothetical protein